jgi:hypothetical protein
MEKNKNSRPSYEEVISILKRDQEDQDALIEYAIYNFELGGGREIVQPLSILVKVMAEWANRKDKETEFKRIKKQVAEIFKHPNCSVELFLADVINESLIPPVQLAPILSWIALSIKEHSAILQAIGLLEKASKYIPDNYIYILNLLHLYLIEYDYSKSMKCANNYFKTYLKEFIFDETTGQLLTEDISSLRKLKSDELDLLALTYSVLKVLYVGGKIKYMNEWINRIEHWKSISTDLPKDLHLTLIRNENSYYNYMKEMAKVYNNTGVFENFEKIMSHRPLYVVGDSHSMSTAYQVIELNGERRVMIPYLVTGVKIWHLRGDSDFYPTYNFEKAIKCLSKMKNLDYVLLMVGEIDTRESFYKCVEKGIYKNIEEAISTVITIYIKKLKEIYKTLNCSLFVSPVLPTLDITRVAVLKYNYQLEKVMSTLDDSRIIYIGGREIEMVDPMKNELKPDYFLDTTHGNPNWLKLISQWKKVDVTEL